MPEAIIQNIAPADASIELLRHTRIMIVGSNHKAAMEQYYLKYLQEFNIPHSLFPAQGLFYEYYEASVLNKIFFKLGLATVYKRISEKLIAEVEATKPDVLFVFKGMEIFPSTLKHLKKMGIKLVNYNPDNPFLFSGSGSGNKNVTESLSLFDLHITYDRSIMHELEKKNLNAAWIPFGFDISDEQFRAAYAEKEVLRVCFLGNPDDTRAAFLNCLATNGLPVDVYGRGWEKFHLNQNIRQHSAVHGVEYWKVLRKYRVQLNLMRPHNPQSHNMRSIELPAVGGIGLFPDTPDHREFFQVGKELFIFQQLEDCCKMAASLLELPQEEANEIREAARTRSLVGNYSYKNRTLQFLGCVKKLT
jgi:hypothetical protein